MKEGELRRIQRHLQEFDNWRASGLSLKDYVQHRGEDLSHWRARLRWEKHWRAQLAQAGQATAPLQPQSHSSHPSQPSPPSFVRLRGPDANAATHSPAQPAACIDIELSGGAGNLRAHIQWPLGQLAGSAAWLREVLS